MTTAAQIRQQFLDFFAQKGHTIVPSAPIVVKNDPTLLFTNAGMNQFKEYFLGQKAATSPRIADTQKCLRVSGKHNDLEEVGVDTYHHTMFEMLGNWSFGDYFKKEAIAWSWELLTEVYGIPKDRLYVTVFGGDAKENLPADEEARAEWTKWIDPARILNGSKKDNFWEMGDTGPCGPCTEIHVDCRPDAERNEVDGSTLVNNDHPQVIEIWNNVFMQFNRIWGDKAEFDKWKLAHPDASKEEVARKVVEYTRLVELPAQHVDTGMGFERLVRVLQGKSSNYDTDVFTPTISTTEAIVGRSYNPAATPQDAGWGEAVAFRVIADHIRAISFTIADGQLPSNTGAGYVIRRILRRAVRYYYSNLGYKQPLLHQLIPGLAAQFSLVFPELKQQQDFVARVVLEEEEAFLRTLDKGLRKIDELMADSTVQQQRTIGGAQAFELFDTYGFPLDLTRLIAQENQLQVDEAGFEAEMQQQKNRSRAATAIDAGDWTILDGDTEQYFTGYTNPVEAARVLRYRKVNAKGKDSYQLVLNQNPFYAESGGQVGDTGVLELADGSHLPIRNTKKENNLSLVFADELPALIDQPVVARIDEARRRRIAAHHSATHLLHAALKQVLGHHVQQKGSLVNEDQLRFDFSHFAKMSDAEIEQVEAIVNEQIRRNVPVIIKEMAKDEAIGLGAMALFGEKYGDVVRVVIMDPAYSIELCGGTHVGHTGELGFFLIRSESAVAAGVRRIEALSGAAAEAYVQQERQLLGQVRTAYKNPKDLGKMIEQQQSELSQLRKQVEALEARQLKAHAGELATEIAGQPFFARQLEPMSADALKKLALELKPAVGAGLALLGTVSGGKLFLALISGNESVKAQQIVKQTIAPLIKGGGGGNDQLATAAGSETGVFDAVVRAVRG